MYKNADYSCPNPKFNPNSHKNHKININSSCQYNWTIDTQNIKKNLNPEHYCTTYNYSDQHTMENQSHKYAN